MNAPAHAERIHALLTHAPRQGYELAHATQVQHEDAHGALAWLEARGHAALRPSDPGRYGWVRGAVELQQ